MMLKLKNNLLGIALTVTYAEIRKDGNLYFTVDASKTQAPIIKPKEDGTNLPFNFIVDMFIKANDIDFVPNGKFESEDKADFVGKRFWGFKIYGKEMDPMEYYLNNN